MKKYIKAYELNYDYIFNIINKRINNREETEDICQEVFFSFYINYDKIKEGSERAWLVTAAKHRLLNFYAVTNKVIIENIDDHEYHKNLQFYNGARDIRIILKEAIENNENFMNDEEKIIFEMIAVFEYKYKEVARNLGLTIRQVEYKFDQISKRITDYLQKKGLKKEDIDE